MTEPLDRIDDLPPGNRRVAVATLVDTRGTTPRKEGARMVVGEGGAVLGSVTIGGCVDAQVIEEAEDALATMRPRLLSVDLGDEDAWEIGLTCGGTIEVFVEPLAVGDGADAATRLRQRARDHAAGGGRAALVTRLDGVGSKLLVLDDGRTEGSLGDAGLDARFAAEARARLDAGSGRTLAVDGVRAFVDVVAPPALLLVVGATHVAMPLCTLARVLGFRTAVVDARPRFATRERFPDADELHVGIPSELVERYALGPSTALVLIAHDYKYDLPILRRALASDIGYVGLLGSTRRGSAILALLAEEGLDAAALARVRVPIGLDLGARSAPEIALAILAEIQAARGGGSGEPLSARARRRGALGGEGTAP